MSGPVLSKSRKVIRDRCSPCSRDSLPRRGYKYTPTTSSNGVLQGKGRSFNLMQTVIIEHTAYLRPFA